MSFGFSVGDFIAVAKLISDISSSIRGASSESYQALDVELHSLKRALDEIEHLPSPPGQEIAVGQVKVAALNCRQPLDAFSAKFKEYGILGPQLGSDKLEKLKKKVQWRWDLEKEAVRLRTTIVAHVAFLNLRLASLGLNSGFIASKKMDDMHSRVCGDLEQVRSEVAESRQEQAALGNMIYEKVTEIASTCIGLRLVSLLELAQQIWSSNIQIVTLVSEMHSRPPRLETAYTWFQEPVRFEDAFGRIMPIPSEYSWSTVHAIILDRFATGLGRDKVKAGEYLLYNSLEPRQPLKQDQGNLMPGMSITMTLIIGRYGPPTLSRCPRVGCMSFKVVSGEFGNKLCTVCRCWFTVTKTSIACPLRYESSMDTPIQEKRQASYFGRRRPGQTPRRGDDSNYGDTRGERRLCKNLSIYAMDLPATPKVANIRRAPRHGQFIILTEPVTARAIRPRFEPVRLCNPSASAMRELEMQRHAVNSVNPAMRSDAGFTTTWNGLELQTQRRAVNSVDPVMRSDASSTTTWSGLESQTQIRAPNSVNSIMSTYSGPPAIRSDRGVPARARSAMQSADAWTGWPLTANLGAARRRRNFAMDLVDEAGVTRDERARGNATRYRPHIQEIIDRNNAEIASRPPVPMGSATGSGLTTSAGPTSKNKKEKRAKRDKKRRQLGLDALIAQTNAEISSRSAIPMATPPELD